ncbi:MAG: serine/threonine protein kinase [Chlamydiales bacterium]|jgi:serine/threonine protein kinase
MTEKDFHKQDTIPDVATPQNKEAEGHATVQKVPEKIGPYPITALLDKGGMSLLFLGEDPNTHLPLTIKVLSPKLVSHPEMVERFFKEAEIIALADHPNVVRLFGHGKWEGGLYIAMEFIKGTLLKEYITRHHLSESRAIEVILEIAAALYHLHTNEIVHRDLKPENILLTNTNKVKVIDFGIAQLLRTTVNQRITQDNRIMGTPLYMSPEQKTTPTEASYPADIYSLGLIAFELFTGKLSHGVIQLDQVNEGLRPILDKALKADPKERYPDIVDMITDLKAYQKMTPKSSVPKQSPIIKDKVEAVPGKKAAEIGNSLSDTAEADISEAAPSPETEKDQETAMPENVKEEQADTQAREQLEELSNHLRYSQQTLLPPVAPIWPVVDIGLVNHMGNNISGIYYDFFDLKEGAYGVIMGESTATGASAVVYTSVLRGMIRALSWSAAKPVELAAYLNELLINDPFDQFFTLSYLILYPDDNQFHYISCGAGSLWKISSGSDTPKKISADNLALGIDAEAEFVEVTHNWDIGDTIILNTYRTASTAEGKQGFMEKDFKKALKQNAFLPPQKQVDALFDKISKSLKHTLEERPITIISLHRTK